MNKMLPICIALSLLAGCANNIENIDTRSKSNLNGEVQAATSMAELDWTTLEIPSTVSFTLNADSQLINTEQSTGPVATFSVPSNRGAINLTLKSFAASTVYAPNIMVLNSNNEVIQTFTADQFEYQPANLMEGDLLKGEFSFIPPLTEKLVKLLVYTTTNDLQGSTELLHPAKAYAIARNTVPPEIPNPIAQHSPYGEFKLAISSPLLQSSSLATTIGVADQAPALDESKGYYLSSIERAVNEGDIGKAMKLLEEAERLGIKDARPTFINAVENKK